MLCTSKPLAKGDLVDHILHTLPMYKDCLGIMKEECKNSRLPHLLMIIVHGETLWSPASQPMDDNDDDDDDDDNDALNSWYNYTKHKKCLSHTGFFLQSPLFLILWHQIHQPFLIWIKTWCIFFLFPGKFSVRTITWCRIGIMWSGFCLSLWDVAGRVPGSKSSPTRTD